MKLNLLISLILMSYLGFSQDYFSIIIPTTDNPLVTTINIDGERIFISADFFGVEGVSGGGILLQGEDVIKMKYENMDLSSDPTVHKGDITYFLGENPFRQGDSTFFISAVDNTTYGQLWYKEFAIDQPKLNPRAIIASEEAIYVINLEIKSAEANYPQQTSVYVFDYDGNLENVWKYNTDKWASGLWNSFISSDSNLILSSLIGPSGPGVYSQVLKIDQKGEVVWNYEGDERLDNGAVRTLSGELSDHSIVQTYYVDRRNDVDFIANNWFPEPNKFIWLSPDGEWLKEKYIITQKEDFLFYRGLKPGTGDYFYTYGFYEDRRPLILDQFYAHLTKFSNEGDTIWSRNYQHPDYTDGNIIHQIKDIYEDENGDITILTDISHPGSKNEVWLFKVNGEGCYIHSDCEDMSTDPTSSYDHSESHFKISPNPSYGVFEVQSSLGIQQLSVFDINGNRLSNIQFDSNTGNLDLGMLERGIYFIRVEYEEGIVFQKRVVKM